MEKIMNELQNRMDEVINKAIFNSLDNDFKYARLYGNAVSLDDESTVVTMWYVYTNELDPESISVDLVKARKIVADENIQTKEQLIEFLERHNEPLREFQA